MSFLAAYYDAIRPPRPDSLKGLTDINEKKRSFKKRTKANKKKVTKP